MPQTTYTGFLHYLYDWQTLIAGVLALAAGAGTVWVTIRSASREIDAAQQQTRATRRQTEVARETERRRIAREGYAFHAMLEGAMSVVIEDVQAGRKLLSGSGPLPAEGPLVNQTGFEELRGAFLRFGGTLTARFLRLDKDIKAQWVTPGDSTVFNNLDRIERQAISLRDEAAGGIKLCLDELAKELLAIDPELPRTPIRR
jgi:hypothetical protein